MRHFLSVILVVLVLSGGLFGIAGLRRAASRTGRPSKFFPT